MNEEITFADVVRKYQEAESFIALNTSLTLGTDVVAREWTDQPTLARWLYGASLEWKADYQATQNKLKNKTGSQSVLMATWSSRLENHLGDMRRVLATKYSSDKLIMEALTA